MRLVVMIRGLSSILGFSTCSVTPPRIVSTHRYSSLTVRPCEGGTTHRLHDSYVLHGILLNLTWTHSTYLYLIETDTNVLQSLYGQGQCRGEEDQRKAVAIDVLRHELVRPKEQEEGIPPKSCGDTGNIFELAEPCFDLPHSRHGAISLQVRCQLYPKTTSVAHQSLGRAKCITLPNQGSET